MILHISPHNLHKVKTFLEDKTGVFFDEDDMLNLGDSAANLVSRTHDGDDQVRPEDAAVSKSVSFKFLFCNKNGIP